MAQGVTCGPPKWTLWGRWDLRSLKTLLSLSSQCREDSSRAGLEPLAVSPAPVQSAFNISVLSPPSQVPPLGPLPPITRCSWSSVACGI